MITTTEYVKAMRDYYDRKIKIEILVVVLIGYLTAVGIIVLVCGMLYGW